MGSLDKKTILFVGAGLETLPGIELALEMGLYVVASDQNLNAPGMLIANHGLQASTYDIEETVRVALKFHNEVRKIDGVLCLGTDVPMTVASVAHNLGLPGISLQSAFLASDKLAMKDCFSDSGVNIPWYSSIHSPSELSDLIATHGALVIKPVDSRGARGVLKIDSETDLNWAFKEAKDNSPTKRVMVEKYLEGPQVSTESIVVDGNCHTIGFSDRNYEFLDRFSPYIIENGGDLPSYLGSNFYESICELVGKAAKAMGIENGVVKGDIVLYREKPHVIELAARLSGGYFCTHEIPLNTGVNFVGAAIRQCLGERVGSEDLKITKNYGVAQRYIFPSTGRILSIEVPGWILKDPNVSLFEVRLKIGDVVEAISSHPSRGGVVIATGPDRNSAIAKANSVIEAVNITTC